MDLEYRKYAIFLGTILIVAGTIACGGKDTASEKDRIKEIGVYDDDNEPVTIQENEIVNTEFYSGTCGHSFSRMHGSRHVRRYKRSTGYHYEI